MRRSRAGKVGVEVSRAGSGSGLEAWGSERQYVIDPVGHCHCEPFTINNRHSLKARKPSTHTLHRHSELH